MGLDSQDLGLSFALMAVPRVAYAMSRCQPHHDWTGPQVVMAVASSVVVMEQGGGQPCGK